MGDPIVTEVTDPESGQTIDRVEMDSSQASFEISLGGLRGFVQDTWRRVVDAKRNAPADHYSGGLELAAESASWLVDCVDDVQKIIDPATPKFMQRYSPRFETNVETGQPELVADSPDFGGFRMAVTPEGATISLRLFNTSFRIPRAGAEEPLNAFVIDRMCTAINQVADEVGKEVQAEVVALLTPPPVENQFYFGPKPRVAFEVRGLPGSVESVKLLDRLRCMPQLNNRDRNDEENLTRRYARSEQHVREISKRLSEGLTRSGSVVSFPIVGRPGNLSQSE